METTTMPSITGELPTLIDLNTISALYASGEWTPDGLIAALMQRIDAADPAVFITRTPPAMLDAAIAALVARAPYPNSLPLWGVPFAVKDNIDVAGLPTTCACPDFDRRPDADATVVAKLVAAGAIVIGKTNLDQFATGLNGTRSPYGAPRSVFDAAHISGGSSSGSVVTVAGGLASFALGTDTAGSGRVPAALNNIVGIKPSLGLFSTTGLVPACRSLDCITVFALSVQDGAVVRRIAQGHDATDPYSRMIPPVALPPKGLRVGILKAADRDFCGHPDNGRLYEEAIVRLGEETVEIDYAPFREIAALLYHGPWVAERLVAWEDTGVPENALDPAVRSIVLEGRNYTAGDAFRGAYRLEELKQLCAAEWSKVDILLLPTAPRGYTVDAMLADPIRLNSNLGLYTNFFNLLGLAGVAVPAGFGSDGMPFGVTLAGAAGMDEALLPLADRLHRLAACGMSIQRDAVPPPLLDVAPPAADTIPIAVVGAHLSGMALNHELQALGATLVTAADTTPDYRLFLLSSTTPQKPGLIHAPGGDGKAIALEVWSLSAAAFGRFVAKIPAPLGIGQINLADGTSVSGFLSEGWAVEGAEEITRFGGWRSFMEASATVK
ncbi:MAG TPA: allophanate hydrolase [Sphingobium sp.]